MTHAARCRSVSQRRQSLRFDLSGHSIRLPISHSLRRRSRAPTSDALGYPEKLPFWEICGRSRDETFTKFCRRL